MTNPAFVIFAVLLFLALAAGVGLYAAHHQRRAWLWFLVSLLITPFLGFLVLRGRIQESIVTESQKLRPMEGLIPLRERVLAAVNEFQSVLPGLSPDHPNAWVLKSARLSAKVRDRFMDYIFEFDAVTRLAQVREELQRECAGELQPLYACYLAARAVDAAGLELGGAGGWDSLSLEAEVDRIKSIIQTTQDICDRLGVTLNEGEGKGFYFEGPSLIMAALAGGGSYETSYTSGNLIAEAKRLAPQHAFIEAVGGVLP